MTLYEEERAQYVAKILAGEVKPPAFTHVAEDGTFTEYTLDEVIDSDKSNIEKRAWLDMHIHNMKRQLVETDYIALKIAEGAATADEYAEQIVSRQAIRDTINTYQDAIDALEVEQ